MLTREETGMCVARNLEMTHEVDGTLKTVDNNVSKLVQGAQTSPTFIDMSTNELVLKQQRASLNVSFSLIRHAATIDRRY